MSAIKLKSSKRPLILVNCKTYPEVSGLKSLQLALDLGNTARQGYVLAIAPPTLTLREVCTRARIPVYAQHVDTSEYGPHTGDITPAEVRKMGATGTILNHSEKKIPLDILARTILVCKDHHLMTVVCASSLPELRRICAFHPDYIAFEPPELIGGNVSVIDTEPEIVLKAVHLVKELSPRTKVLCGAGVHTRQDVGQALLLGTDGVLLSHAVVRARDPTKFMEGLLV